MKLILTIILLLIQEFSIGKYTPGALKLTKEDSFYNKEEYNRLRKYNEVIEFIKFHEGFSSTVYNDNGWDCQCYGQRLAFYDGEIPDTATVEKCDSILRDSFDKHISMVNRVYPGLTIYQSYAVAHMSYGIGIGTLLEGKYLYRSSSQWKINLKALYFYRPIDSLKNYKQNRFFEYKLFNYKI